MTIETIVVYRDGFAANLPCHGINNLSRTALLGHVAERLFALQHAIKHLNNRQQLDRVCFLARSLGEGAPITRLWGHGKPPFYVSDFPKLHSFPRWV
jgi:hypothetical protein